MQAQVLEQTSIVEFNVNRLRNDNNLVRQSPFPFFVAKDQLSEDLYSDLKKDFPQYKSAGYLPYEPSDCGEAVNALVDYMTSDEFSNAVGEKLGIENLSQYPTMVSISKTLNKRHGTIHTDGKAKVATVLMYLNKEWNHGSDGCFRFLNRIDDIEDTVMPEVTPVFGTLAGFKRCDNSFHGHLPFEGERRVVQVAWIINEAEKQRKMNTGKKAHGLKKLLGWIDKKIGAGRDKSASHRD